MNMEKRKKSLSTPTPEPTVELEPVPEVETKMVWLSATVEKVHSIPDCGRMNPNTARNVPDSGYDYCSKCW